jgi:hypothetical protein
VIGRRLTGQQLHPFTGGLRMRRPQGGPGRVAGGEAQARREFGEARAMVSLPVTGQFGSVPAAGQATTDSDGVGKFRVQTPGGVRCHGEFQVRDPGPALVVLGKCSNGKSGQIVITRTANLMSGSAIVPLGDGTRGQFVFGDLPSGQAFGAGGSAQVR